VPQVWKEALQHKQQSPYMTHDCELGSLRGLAFCPYEDVLGMGSSQGVSSMLVPGAGARPGQRRPLAAGCSSGPCCGCPGSVTSVPCYHPSL
jgi:hypothetical protein